MTKMRPRNSDIVNLCSVVSWLFGFALMFCHPCISSGQASDSVVATCNATGITVTVKTKGVFQGSIFASGSFFNPNCRTCFAKNATKSATLFLSYTDCGNLLGTYKGEVYISNVIVMQSHCLFETMTDTVHNVSCKLPHPDYLDNPGHHSHESHPARFADGHVEAWMNFMYKGNVLGTDVPNTLLVGDDLTVVVHLKDGNIYSDLQVERCWVYDGETISTSRYTVVIYDKQSCQKSKWVSGFNYTRLFKEESEAVSYGFMRAFKFPHSKDLHFTCTIQVCRDACFDYCHQQRYKASKYLNRQRRQSNNYRSESYNYSLLTNLSKRSKAVTATLKKLGKKLREKNEQDTLSKDIRFNRRVYDDRTPLVAEALETTATIPKPETTTVTTMAAETTTEVWAGVMYFNLTNNIVVYSSRDLVFEPESSAQLAETSCVPKSRYALVAGLMSTIIVCLILTCIVLVFLIRREKKNRPNIENFLLYNVY